MTVTTEVPRVARMFVAGAWVDGGTSCLVEDKFTGLPRTRMQVASGAQVDRAMEGVAAAQAAGVPSSSRRFEILAEAGRLLWERRTDFVDAVVVDTGFTVSDATNEVTRARETLLLCAEEAKRFTGRVVPMHAAPVESQRMAFTVRHPLGVICAITPFNSPLNTVVHKVGPALAAGNGVVLKPAETTPLTASMLVQLLLDAGLPPGLVALLHGSGEEVGQRMLEHPAPALYAFTGSTSVGEHIRRTVGLRRVQLELGSISSTFVCGDADRTAALRQCVTASFRKAGQVCTSIQRLYVSHEIAEEFLSDLVRAVEALRVGDPRDSATDVGPVISEKAAERIVARVDDATAAGATLLTGGTRTGRLVAPTVLTDVAPDMQVMRDEVFGPVVCVRVFDRLTDAIEEANATPYGLAAGIFTRDIDAALVAARALRMGAVHVNATSSSRVDLMPYSGVKRSGLGVEGPRYAIEEMTEERLVTIGS